MRKEWSQVNRMNRKHSINLLAFGLALVLLLGICGAALPGDALADTPSGWYQQTSGVSGQIYSVSAISKTTAWAGGDDGILKTTDGGATWHKQGSFSSGSTSVCALNSQVIWAIVGGDLYKTSNGGTTWSLVKQFSSYFVHTGAWASTVATTDSKNIWVVVNSFAQYMTDPTIYYGCGICRTEDGGATWSDAQGGGYSYGFPASGAVCALDGSTAWAAGIRDPDHYSLIEKTGPGTGWTTQFLPANTYSLLINIAAADTDNAWAVGGMYSGVVLRTSDGGIGWQSQYSHTMQQLTSVSAVDAHTAWAVGLGGAIIKTTDGETWEPQASGVATDLRAVEAVDAQTAWAVGDGGVILHTTDGGGAPVPHLEIQSVSVNEDQTELTLTGSGFGSERGYTMIGAVRVDWDYGYPIFSYNPVMASDYISWSDTEIKCVITPPEEGFTPGVYEVMLLADNIYFSNRFFTLGQFTAVTSLTPYWGNINSSQNVTMNGYGFDGPNLAVHVSNASATIPVSNVVVVSPEELTCTLDLTGQPAGKYDVSVSSDYTSYSYKNGFTALEPKIYKIVPNTSTNLVAAPVTISGQGFLPGATVSLVSGSNVIDAVNVSVKSGSLITCNFSLLGKATGKYDVVVHNPGGHDLVLSGGFTVTNACGQSAGISVSLFAGLMGLLSVAGLGLRRRRLKA
jgi:photosystem II stability/assembly factor-like uncharacterized protein